LEVSAISKNELMINEEIRDREVRLVDETGKALGIVSSKEALKIAYEKNLDLVKIAPNANPPVCKIMDYGKYMFDLAKKEKEVRKNQKIVNVKEVRIGLDIGEHDFNVKVKQAIRFLKSEDKVKLTVRFVGREMNFTDRGHELINRFVECVSEVGTMEKKPKLEGRRMSVIINPK
jgi:translation initiation factor IF-3